MPEPASALQLFQCRCLGLIGIHDQRLHTRIQVSPGHLNIFHTAQSEPAVAPAPEDAAEIMVSVKGPSVVEQTGLFIIQIFDVHEHLVDAFIDPFFPFVFLSHFIQEENGHEQGIDPHLIFIQPNPLPIPVGTGHVLEAPLLCPGNTVHEPVRPAQAEFLELRVMVIFIQLRKSQKRSRSVDIAGRQPQFHIPHKPVVQKLLIFLIFILPHDPKQAIQPYSLGPVPFPDPEVPLKKSNRFPSGFFQLLFIFRPAQIQKLLDHKIQLSSELRFVHLHFFFLPL